MSIISIAFSTEFLGACAIYAIAIMLALPLFAYIHRTLEHSLLQWVWDHIGMPLLRAALMLLFIILAYPLIFGLTETTSLGSLLAADELRINHLMNLIFIVTLLFPLVPFLGKWEELILPSQAITACAMLFSWLAEDLGIKNIVYWPGMFTTLSIIAIAVINHWLAQALAQYLGGHVDQKLNVKDAGILASRALVLFMQSPAILLYSSALGRQLI